MKPRTIQIVPVLNGFLVHCGCQSVVMKTPDELGNAITEYYKDPLRMEALYLKNKVNDTLDNGPINPDACGTIVRCETQPQCETPRIPEPARQLTRDAEEAITRRR